MKLSPETLDFIDRHRHDDVRTLALQAGKYPDIDMTEAVVQIAGRQAAEKKIPLFAQTDSIRYPKHLPMEQCSSETTARFKATLAEGDTMADLTGGFGIDCTFLSQRFRKAFYVERQAELCELARHNFPLLGRTNIEVRHADGIGFLKEMEEVDCIFLDPARRDNHGSKTVFIADCEPNVCAWEDLLTDKAKTVLVKLSPMLDIASALRELKYVREVHVIAVNNECKELVVILRKPEKNPGGASSETLVCCDQSSGKFLEKTFVFFPSDEQRASCSFAEQVETYLYEPGAALLKAAPYKLLSERFGVKKLHPNSHLYTSHAEVDFPGRRFKVEKVSGFGKKELKDFLQDLPQANLTVRNFPSTVAELRKKLKLKEGGDRYLFATTLNNGEKVLIKCIKNDPPTAS